MTFRLKKNKQLPLSFENAQRAKTYNVNFEDVVKKVESFIEEESTRNSQELKKKFASYC
ncbi:hypothetical protein [Sediminitomix flava]|uniref:Uncharacterized protein n=1 Tax=Sediminitomix flava TaxID=379075 RepID=A0A315Z7N7_SEDFL|nr:hypothetical protein [Sediminitomix flava]PWJ40756.1 hypothetical protein BC781_10414 [Sediminitomix flava]